MPKEVTPSSRRSAWKRSSVSGSRDVTVMSARGWGWTWVFTVGGVGVRFVWEGPRHPGPQPTVAGKLTDRGVQGACCVAWLRIGGSCFASACSLACLASWCLLPPVTAPTNRKPGCKHLVHSADGCNDPEGVERNGWSFNRAKEQATRERERGSHAKGPSGAVQDRHFTRHYLRQSRHTARTSRSSKHTPRAT